MRTSQKRATIYFDPDIHRALRVKAAETDRSISALVNEAVKLRFNLPFEDVLKDLKKRGKI
jgi:predicted HicB family RNase H-like nuclease